MEWPQPRGYLKSEQYDFCAGSGGRFLIGKNICLGRHAASGYCVTSLEGGSFAAFACVVTQLANRCLKEGGSIILWELPHGQITTSS